MKGTRPLDNDDIRNLGLAGGLNFRWQYKHHTTHEYDEIDRVIHFGESTNSGI